MKSRFSTLDRFDRTATALIAAFLLASGLVALCGDRVGARVRAFDPADGAENVSTRAPLHIVFQDAMAGANVESRLHVKPETPGFFEWQGSALFFRPDDGWSTDTCYTATLTAGARSAQGRQVLRDLTWRFCTGHPRLLYLHDLDLGHWQLFVLSPGDGEPVQLTDAPGGVFDYAPSPDGTTIAYAALREDGGADLWAVDADGNGRRALLACPGARCTSPAWSPDGGRIAYERREIGEMGAGSGAPRVWLLDPATGETAPLFEDESAQGSVPRWSPVGARLVYFDPSQENAVHVYDLDVGSSVLIPSQSGLPGAWSPDGSRLLITSVELLGSEVVYHLWLADLDGGDLANISGQDAPVQDAWPAWSPSGDWIAFTRRALAGEHATAEQQPWLMRPDGSQARPLLVDPTAAFGWTAWRPDGGALAYVRRTLTDPDARPEVWLMVLPDGEPVRLAEASTAPAWLP
jgi:Tol biopolymer transport system component